MMNAEPDFSKAIVVGAVPEEYESVRQTRCACGGEFVVRHQELLHDDGGRCYDALSAECEECGERREFLFDINSFFQADPVLAPLPAPPVPPPGDIPGDISAKDEAQTAAPSTEHPSRSARPRAPRDRRVVRATLDLCALIACVFAIACLAFAYFLAASIVLIVGCAFWFSPLDRAAGSSARPPAGS